MRASSLVIRVKAEEEADDFNLLATSSTLAVLSVLDAVMVALVGFTGYTRERFAVIHPGGAVGRLHSREGSP